jgi:hypothetical protein
MAKPEKVLAGDLLRIVEGTKGCGRYREPHSWLSQYRRLKVGRERLKAIHQALINKFSMRLNML